MYFQSLDDKHECVGVYADGKLHFDNTPENLTHTWAPGGYQDDSVEYAWIYCNGLNIDKACPDNLKEAWDKVSRKIVAYKKSFDIAKINLRDHCFFDLVPHDALVEFCDVKNQITQHVFENNEKPENYDYMASAARLLHKIKHQDLNLNNSDCRNLFVSSNTRQGAQKLLNGPKYVNYNLYGTVTGRLATKGISFPILTAKKELRRIIKPHNDWFLSLDYNGAEARTVLALSGELQPEHDIHNWNIVNVFRNPSMNREEAKTLFFAWLYNPESKDLNDSYYDRKKILDKWYDGEYITTVFGRHIKVNDWKALNYLIQSTTADLVIERAIAIDKFLKGKRTFISHIVHDEIVIDFADEDRDLVKEIKEIFANNKLARYEVNLNAGKNYFDLELLRL